MIQKKTYVEYVTATGDSYKTLGEARYEQKEELKLQVRRMINELASNDSRSLHMHLTHEQKDILYHYLLDYPGYAQLAALSDERVAEEDE